MMVLRCFSGFFLVARCSVIPALTGFLLCCVGLSAQDQGLLREVYTDIPGNEVELLLQSSKYPDNPDFTDYVTDFEAPTNVLENYGQRVHGYIIPPVSGSYRFWISSDDNSQLFLSTDSSPVNARMIAHVPEWTSARQWNAFEEQRSESIPLVGHKVYYVSAIMKEGVGGDNLAVRWELPNGEIEEPVPAARLLPFGITFEAPRIAVEPQDIAVDENSSATFSVVIENLSPVTYQWRLNDDPVPGASGPEYVLPYARLSQDGARIGVTLTNSQGEATSRDAILSVKPETQPPTLVKALNLDSTRVRVEFSERVSVGSAEAIESYACDNSVEILKAEVESDGLSVVLTTSGLANGTRYELSVSGVSDLAATPNEIESGAVIEFTAVEFVPLSIGESGVEGSATPIPGGVRVEGAGADVGGRSDGFFYAYQERLGDFDVRVRVRSLENVDPWAKAGLMARSELSGESVFAGAFAAPSVSGAMMLSRTLVGREVARAGKFPVNYPNTWLRLRRSGSNFTAYAGLDGIAWEELGAVNVFMPEKVFLGMAVASRDRDTAVAADFQDLSDVDDPKLFAGPLPREPLGPSSRRTGISLSEVMYHPSDREDGADLSFIEIYNSQPFFEDIGGYRLSGDVDFTFPEGIHIEGGEFLVVAKDPAAFAAAYGLSDVMGPYEGDLNRNAGLVRLRGQSNALLLEVAYQDEMPWPVAADGAGHSLVLARPSYGEGDFRAWSASAFKGGSPGTDDPMIRLPMDGVVINEFLSHTEAPKVDYIELYNTTPSAVDVSGGYLSDSRSVNKYRIPDGLSIPPGGHLLFDQLQLGFNLDSSGDSIYFTDPSDARVLDAVRFEGQALGVAMGRIPDGSVFHELSEPSPGSRNGGLLIRDVVINEIMYNPISQDDDDEYIELYNKGIQAVDLSGWCLTDGIEMVFPQGVVIPAGGFIVVARDAARLIRRYNALSVSNTIGDFAGRLSNSGERIRLLMPQNSNGADPSWILVDEITYSEGGRWGQWSDRGGSSLELVDPRSDNRMASNWADSDESHKSDWVSFEAEGRLDWGTGSADEVHVMLLGAGECLIDGIEITQEGGNLIGNGGFESGLDGWTLGGNHVHSRLETGNGYSSSQSLRIVASSGGDNGANRVESDLNTAMNTGGSGKITAHARWLRGHRDLLVRLKGNYLEAVGHLPVPEELGTPGKVNSTWVENAGPAIYGVTHSPILPAPGQSVRVTARFQDPDGISNTTLSYRVDPGVTRRTLSMRDDGQGGDLLAGDGIYTALIPGQSRGALAGFYVSASDGSAKAATSVYPESGAAGEALIRWGENRIAGEFGEYRMWFTQGRIAEWTNREKLSNEGLDGTFVYGNSRVIYNMASRYRGSPFIRPGYSSPVGSLSAYIVEMPADDRFLGTTEFNLDWLEQPGRDSTLQREKMSFWIGNRLGVAYSHQRYIYLTVNGVRRGEVYTDSQQPNNEYLRGWQPRDDAGELFKIDDWFEFNDGVNREFNRDARLGVYETTGGVKKKARYRWSWEKKFNRGLDDDYSSFYDLVDAMNAGAAGSESYERGVTTLVDVEQWARVFATRRIVGDWDGYSYSRGKNQFLYKPKDGKWRMFLWDLDFSLGGGSNSAGSGIFDGINDPVISKFYSHPAFRRAYLRAMRDALDGPLLSENMDPVMDGIHEAFRQGGVNAASPESIKSWVQQRRLTLEQAVSEGGGVFEVTSGGGADFSVDDNYLTLEGTAPVQAREIEFNGTVLPVEWTSVNRWRAALALEPGANAFVLNARDAYRNPIPGFSDSITVEFNGEAEEPLGSLILSEIMYHPATVGGEFVEVHNLSSSTSFDLGGLRLSGADITFDSGTVIRPGEYAVVVEDPIAFDLAYGGGISVLGNYEGRLDNDGEWLRLIRPGTTENAEVVFDEVRFNDRLPWAERADGLGPSLQLIDLEEDNGRPGNWGAASGQVTNPTPVLLVDYDGVWRFDERGVNPDPVWQSANYDDTSWKWGQGLLYVENSSLPAPKNTPLTLGSLAYYFRGEFQSETAGGGDLALLLSPVVDDGVVVYLNGEEILRLGMNPGEPTANTLAARTVGDAAVEGPFEIPSTALRQGRNVLAAEVHQTNAGSSDIVFGLRLEAVENVAGPFTPGAPNSLEADLPPFRDLWLNELQIVNDGSARDAAGDADPWIELYNAGASALDLSEYYLTADLLNYAAWRFPAGTVIEPNAYLVVWLDGEASASDASEIHAGFDVSGLAFGRLALSRDVGDRLVVVDDIRWEFAGLGQSFGLFPDGFKGTERFFLTVTPGAPNTLAAPDPDVAINEWMALNEGAFIDPSDGSFDDWFELYNFGTGAVDLTGFTLSDDPTNVRKFVIPPGYIMPPKGFLLVWADEDASETLNSGGEELHVNFKLSAAGEYIGLFEPDGSVVDSVEFGLQTSNRSEGLNPDGAIGAREFLDFATPGRGLSLRDTYRLRGRVSYFSAALNAVPEMKFRIIDSQGDRVHPGGLDGAFDIEVASAATVELQPLDPDELSVSRGVDVADVVEIRKHILRRQLLSDGYHWLAADVNRDNAVDVRDLVAVRRLILGRTSYYSGTEVAPDSIWRHVVAGQTFADPERPFDELGDAGERERRVYSQLDRDRNAQDFVALKLGDANGDWTPIVDNP